VSTLKILAAVFPQRRGRVQLHYHQVSNIVVLAKREGLNAKGLIGLDFEVPVRFRKDELC